MFEIPGHEVNSAETVAKSTVKVSRVLASAKVCLAPISAEPFFNHITLKNPTTDTSHSSVMLGKRFSRQFSQIQQFSILVSTATNGLFGEFMQLYELSLLARRVFLSLGKVVLCEPYPVYPLGRHISICQSPASCLALSAILMKPNESTLPTSCLLPSFLLASTSSGSGAPESRLPR